MTTTFDLTNALKPTILKSLGTALEYSWDWSEWLARVNDSLASATVINVVGITVGLVTVAGAVVTAIVSAGTVGTGSATCRIVTAGGRIEERTMYFKVVQR